VSDPKQIADALAQDQLLAQFNRDEASAEPWWRKGLSMEGRDTFLPFKYSQPTLPGSVMNQRELALPGLLAGAVNQFTAGGRAYTGSDPTFNPQEEALNFATNVMGGGLGLSKTLPVAADQGGIYAGMAYRPNLPKTPDPSVGTRFQSEYIGGLVDKTPFDLSTKKGASILISPWDSSSRNQRITNVSDIELPRPVITHGGQDFAREIQHVQEGIGGASNLGIANRLKTRDEIARAENLAAGGTGEIFYMPSTMGQGAENFSVMPANILTGIIDKSNAPKSVINDLDQSIRDFKIFKGVGEKRVMTQPFKDFKGIMTEEGRGQLLTGEGVGSTAGELRKALADRMYMVGNQKAFGFNAEDAARSIIAKDLIDVPKGYIGNTVIQGSEGGMKLLPPTSPSYNTNTSGTYAGTLGGHFPIETLMPDAYAFAAQKHVNKKANLRNMAIADLEKSNKNVAQIINNQVIENYQKRLAELLKTGARY
jgi:hypothetical protein